jgi:hypothetical protein
MLNMSSLRIPRHKHSTAPTQCNTCPQTKSHHLQPSWACLNPSSVIYPILAVTYYLNHYTTGVSSELVRLTRVMNTRLVDYELGSLTWGRRGGMGGGK